MGVPHLKLWGDRPPSPPRFPPLEVIHIESFHSTTEMFSYYLMFQSRVGSFLGFGTHAEIYRRLFDDAIKYGLPDDLRNVPGVQVSFVARQKIMLL